MGFYAKHILPHVLDCACRTKPVQKQRETLVPKARGRVLEIGLGDGLNLPFYDAEAVAHLWALEPAAEMRRLARDRVDESPISVEIMSDPVVTADGFTYERAAIMQVHGLVRVRP